MRALLITRDGLESYVDVPIAALRSGFYRRPVRPRLGLDTMPPTEVRLETRDYETNNPDPHGVTIFYEL